MQSTSSLLDHRPFPIGAAEREQLVRYCLRFTRDRATAEDLAQQTLLEAWQQAHKLQRAEVPIAWLYGMARYVGLRWLRRRRREQARQAAHTTARDAATPEADTLPAVEMPLEQILERAELAQVLEQALAVLPAPTRAVLLARYIEEAPQAAVAARLGMSEGAVEARLQRGKHALRRVLTTTFRDQIAAYDVGTGEQAAWRPTALWCPTCGRERLEAQLPSSPGTIMFRCPGCDVPLRQTRAEYRLANTTFRRVIGGVAQPRALLKRAAAWAYDYYTQALDQGEARCTNCGRLTPVQILLRADRPVLSEDLHVLSMTCAACGEEVCTSLGGRATSAPQVQQFWRRYPRMRQRPVYDVEASGQVARVIGFESVTDSARLDIVIGRDSFRVLAVEGAGAGLANR